MIKTTNDARKSIVRAIPLIWRECVQVLGSELHYQAMIYHCLRTEGKVPLGQIGMNVKIYITHPQSDFFKQKLANKKGEWAEGFEPIPDITIFSEKINNDWRRRNYDNTLKESIYALELKASERQDSRLRYKEIKNDIDKLIAQDEETWLRHKKRIGKGRMIIDTAPKKEERMKPDTLGELRGYAKQNGIDFWYLSPEKRLKNN